MVRAVIVSILAVALLCMPASVRHDLICTGDGLEVAVARVRHGCGHKHHGDQHHDEKEHRHSGACLDVAKAGVGIGSLALAGLAVVSTQLPVVGFSAPAVVAPDQTPAAAVPFRPPPGRMRLIQLSSFRI
ncbi:MAG: hypothetical protein IT462_04380 [Planctomycetes bacterium]|nr:hypothetical protein [Planctomycetota bacterium]